MALVFDQICRPLIEYVNTVWDHIESRELSFGFAYLFQGLATIDAEGVIDGLKRGPSRQLKQAFIMSLAPIAKYILKAAAHGCHGGNFIPIPKDSSAHHPEAYLSEPPIPSLVRRGNAE
ncbi:MAG TPA: hypothetical protein VFE90_18670 [Myxococcales bacterium]|nr:hypothetical protein [Myxococcales bacterium]